MKKEKDVVAVLTRKAIETMMEEGGSGNWRASERMLSRCKWVVTVRNGHSSRREGHEEHGTAFLIGRIAGLRPSVNPEQPDRKVIAFDRYARINIPSAWRKGHRNPVAYTTLDDLGIDFEKLTWKEVPISGPEHRGRADSKVSHEIPAAAFEQARNLIAGALSIAPSAVRISIEI